MRKLFIVLSLVLAPAFSALAQQPKLADRWLMNDGLVDIADAYERYSRFDESSDIYAFKDLFKTDSTMVYCDYLASPDFGKVIPLGEYIAQTSVMKDRTVRISNLKKGELVNQRGQWHCSLEFDKLIEYEDSLGFVFSSRSKEAGGDCHMILDCVWDSEEKMFSIESINGKSNVSPAFAKGDFYVVERKNTKDDNMVLYNNNLLEFNDYGVAFLPVGGSFDLNDDDYVLSVNERDGAGRYKVLNFDTKAKKNRFRTFTTFHFFNPLKTDLANTSSFDFEVGAEYGFMMFNLGRSDKILLYMGGGLHWSNLKVKKSTAQYTYLDRTYDISATESLAFNGLVACITPSYEHNFSKRLTLSVDFRFKLYADLWANDDYRVSFVNNKVIYKGEEDSPNLVDNYMSPNKTKNNIVTFALAPMVGVDYSPKSGMYLYGKVGASFGMIRTEVFKNPEKEAVSWYDDKSGIFPVIYRINEGKVEDIRTHSFKSSINSINRGFSIPLELGLRIKF